MSADGEHAVANRMTAAGRVKSLVRTGDFPICCGLPRKRLTSETAGDPVWLHGAGLVSTRVHGPWGTPADSGSTPDGSTTALPRVCRPPREYAPVGRVARMAWVGSTR